MNGTLYGNEPAPPTEPAATATEAMRKAEALRQGQTRLLEMIAKNEPLGATMGQLMRLIESQGDGVLCSLMLLEDDQLHVRSCAGPSLPPSYLALLDGLTIGPCAGSCGTAMYRRQPVVVDDIMSSPLWAPYLDLVKPYGLRACWSTPIMLKDDQVLGSFAMYYREPRSPGPAEAALIAVATHIAGIAIEREKNESELRRHRDQLEALVQQRTSQLEASNAELTATLVQLQHTQRELVRTEKLASLGTLVAGVAHELNTPLGNAMLSAGSLVAHAQRIEDAVARSVLKRSDLLLFLADIAQGGTLLTHNLARVNTLIQHFKQLAVDQTTDLRSQFALHTLVQRAVDGVAPRVDMAAHQIVVDIAADIVMDSYPDALTEVLRNLLDNALVHGLPAGQAGTVRITAGLADGGNVRLELEDSGHGIASELLPCIFDPFFTTRLGQGTSGLGLYVTHNLVTGVLGGHISVESQAGQGTRFLVELPQTAPRP